MQHASPSLALLSEYDRSKAECLIQRRNYTKAVQTTQAILAKYEPEFSKELHRIKELRTTIRFNTHGMPTEPFEESLYMGIAASQRETDAAKAICKGLYKALAQKYHPDKGGDPQLFAEIYQAYKQYDIDFLRIQWILLAEESSLDWRISTGVDFWKEQLLKSKHELKILQESRWYSIVRLHVSGQRQQAKETMKQALNARIFELQSELNHLVTK